MSFVSADQAPTRHSLIHKLQLLGAVEVGWKADDVGKAKGGSVMADVQEFPDYYEEYLHAVEMARIQHEPAADWDAFVDGLWGELVPALGLDS